MKINDFIFPITALAIILVLVWYFRKFNNIEGFETFNLTDYQVNIIKNLFLGFDSLNNSDKQMELIKEATPRFQDILGRKDLNNSIFIKGQTKITPGTPITQKINKICLGSGDDKCLDSTIVNNFTKETNNIPYFKSGNTQVYYNEDQPIVRHNKLCYYDNQRTAINEGVINQTLTEGERCINSGHLDMINGNNAVKLKFRNGNNYNELKPYNVEYGAAAGFSNIVTRPFYTDSNILNTLVDKIDDARTCFGGGGRQHHIAYRNNTPLASSFYMVPSRNPAGNMSWSHVHSHISE